MNVVATTWVTIYTGTTTDEYDDEVDLDIVVDSHVPASIIESEPTLEGGETSTPREIRRAVLRVNRNATIEKGMRVRDEITGDWYIVDGARKTQNPAVPTDLKVNLRWQSREA